MNSIEASTFYQKLLPAPISGGFRMDDYWIWCGSVILGEDGRYHMFASRWPRSLPFTPHWVICSEIVRASADIPEGPYRFEEVVLPARGASCWDGRMTHNPSIHRFGDTYLLYYTGTTYEDDLGKEELMAIPPGGINDPLTRKARENQRIGLATSRSIYGPWTRSDTPILSPRPGQWDSMMVTNPAPCVRPDGRVLLVYKSVAYHQDLMRLGVAEAHHFSGPYLRRSDDPILSFDLTNDHVEDGYVWWDGEANRYEMIMKDMKGGISGESCAGVSCYSNDGVHWSLHEPALAYSRHIKWSDGTESVQGCLERPQLLIAEGKPTHLFAATADGPGGFGQATRSWNMVIPLR
jgi:hypothetical protein